MPLLSADVLAAAVVAAEGFDPAQPRRPWRMKDLQHQFIGQEGVGARVLLAAARHRSLEIDISLESGNLAVGGVGVFLHLQQLIAKQGTTDGRGVEAAIAY